MTKELGTFENPFPLISTPEQFESFMENIVLPKVKEAKKKGKQHFVCVPEGGRKRMIQTIDLYRKIHHIPRGIYDTLKIEQEEKA